MGRYMPTQTGTLHSFNGGGNYVATVLFLCLVRLVINDVCAEPKDLGKGIGDFRRWGAGTRGRKPRLDDRVLSDGIYMRIQAAYLVLEIFDDTLQGAEIASQCCAPSITGRPRMRGK